MEEKHLCSYCGQEAHYQLKNSKWCCSKNYQSCPEIKKKNRESLKNKNHYGLKKWNEMRKNGIVNSWNKGLTKETDERIKEGVKKLKEKYKNKELKNWF